MHAREFVRNGGSGKEGKPRCVGFHLLSIRITRSAFARGMYWAEMTGAITAWAALKDATARQKVQRRAKAFFTALSGPSEDSPAEAVCVTEPTPHSSWPHAQKDKEADFVSAPPPHTRQHLGSNHPRR